MITQDDELDGASLMSSLGLSPSEAARVVVDVNLGRDADAPVSPSVAAEYDWLAQRLAGRGEAL